MKYFFIPGRKWALSQTELTSVLGSNDIKHVPLASDEAVFTYDLHIEQGEGVDLFSRLGGFTKAGFLIDDPFEFVTKVFIPSLGDDPPKVPFSLSIHHQTGSQKSLKRNKHKTGMQIKKFLKEQGLKARFVASPEDLITSAVLLTKQGVIGKGFELNLMRHPKTGLDMWGITLAVQDYEGFSERDYDRPRVNKKKGMLPPKLARMMVNYAGQPRGNTLWDPFCGSGTVMMEALLLGYKVVGSDVDPVSISETTENLAWLCEKFKISHTQYHVFQHDIMKGLPKEIDYDAIVTEPYLGPVQQEELSLDAVEKVLTTLDPIYSSIGVVGKETPKQGKKRRMVLVVPGFKTAQGWLDMQLSIDDNTPLSDITKNVSRYPLQWDRPNSIIRRNIKIFEY